jgi:hypothetical protein
MILTDDVIEFTTGTEGTEKSEMNNWRFVLVTEINQNKSPALGHFVAQGLDIEEKTSVASLSVVNIITFSECYDQHRILLPLGNWIYSGAFSPHMDPAREHLGRNLHRDSTPFSRDSACAL